MARLAYEVSMLEDSVSRKWIGDRTETLRPHGHLLVAESAASPGTSPVAEKHPGL